VKRRSDTYLDMDRLKNLEQLTPDVTAAQSA
jgi:hypothetical protein